LTLLIPAGFGQAVASFDFIGGQSNPLNMVFGYQNTNAQSPAAAAATIGGQIGTAFAGVVFTNQVTFLSLSVIQNPGQQTGLAVFSTPGGSAGLCAPPNTAYLVHKVSTLGGRPGRGRMYWPSVDTGDVNEAGVVNGPSLVVLQSAMTVLFQQLAVLFLPMVILHTSPAIPPTVISGLVADPVVATQRRRLRS